MDQITRVTLLLSDGFARTISRKAAKMSELLKDDVEILVLDSVEKAAFEKVVEFLEHHAEDPMRKIPVPIPTNDIVALVGEWDATFIDVDLPTIYEILKAAKYLGIKPLLDLGTCKIACMIKGEESETVKEIFGIEGDITPEEEKRVREKNSWLFGPQNNAQL